MSYSQKPLTPWGGRAYLLFDMFRGLREVNTLPARLPIGTYMRSGGSWQMWALRQRGGRKEFVWEFPDDSRLPKRLKTEMLLLGIS